MWETVGGIAFSHFPGVMFGGKIVKRLYELADNSAALGPPSGKLSFCYIHPAWDLGMWEEWGRKWNESCYLK